MDSTPRANMHYPHHLANVFSSLADRMARLREPRCHFQCNICGQQNVAHRTQLDREIASRRHCHSTVRMRAMIHALSIELFGISQPIEKFPVRPEIVGIGLSDWVAYAQRLVNKFSYQNTFFSF